ncbi:twin-arginine translocation signal domain-containing protein [Paracidobacterium acidisoli]|uniref:Twin-arginine translocation signal domain-containing protein n=1 Tax=Paracidobacterium acidisoli TaxID=2303751 RepID=A0A372IRB0_9BACT|nr:twin-arginine translocation signal domain-containing protein [Paracidobacterium acidisoli]MBT9330326.1 twin-arginine translocation signal domain-containing protein [Paracidobacterium acidisoli]
MQRRDFLKGGAAAAGVLGIGTGAAQGIVPAHNWSKYDFGSGPAVKDRLNQGPFPQYPPDAVIPSDEVVMTTTPSDEVVPNYGKGLVTYITADMGTEEIKSDNVSKGIEDLVNFPLGQKLYIRPTWREVQPRPGRLELPDYVKLVFDLAKKSGKQVGLRIQMSAPDYWHAPALPDFVLERVPKVDLVLNDPKDQAAGARFVKNPYSRYQPRFDDPFFQQCFRELVGQLAAEFDGNPSVEFIDTFMYGFWGEGHTWPFSNNPFPDYQTAERTWMDMLEVQLDNFKKTPLLTNTQPDFSRVGNSEMLDCTVRSNNWIRSDTIFIENEQIEALSNRPPWIGALLEQGLPGKPADPKASVEGISPAENMIAHVMDIGANYWSLWNFHQISAQNLAGYYQAYPAWFDRINRKIGYRVRPSFIWGYEADGYTGLIIGFANDGIAGVPGVLRVTVESEDGKPLRSGCLDPGYPLPGKIRQAQIVLPKGTKWQGLKLKAEIEVKEMRYPVRWACHQQLNEDGSLTLRANLRQEV